jgi:hypothetical protein
MPGFTEQLQPSFPPLITGHVYENHFKLQKYGRRASIEWIHIELNDAKIYNAGIYVSDTRLWDLNNSGKTVMNFPVGLAYCSEIDLIVWTKNNVAPKVSIKITYLSDAELKRSLSRPIDWKFGTKIYRFNAGDFGYIADVDK